MGLKRKNEPTSCCSSDYEDAVSDMSKFLSRGKLDAALQSSRMNTFPLTSDHERDRFNRVYQYVLHQYAKKFDNYDETKNSSNRTSTISNHSTKCKKDQKTDKGNCKKCIDVGRNVSRETVTCERPINFIRNDDPAENESIVLTDEELESSSSSEYGDIFAIDQKRNYEMEQALKEIGRRFMQKKTF